MAGKLIRHKHLDLSEVMFSRLKREAEELEIPVSEHMRHKLEKPPVPREILLLRELEKLILKNYKGGVKNGLRKAN